MLSLKPHLQRTTCAYFLLDSALCALFSGDTNLHPFTEINYNHEYKSFPGSCESLWQIIQSEDDLGDPQTQDSIISTPIQYVPCMSCVGYPDSSEGVKFPLPHPRGERAMHTLTWGFSTLSWSISSSSRPVEG